MRISQRRMTSCALGGALWVSAMLSPAVYANIPAAYLACEGAELREDCVMTGPQYGVCLRDTLCEDPPETEVNECVLCVDACWGQEEGTSCVRPWTGEEGVCEAQEQCTDREETSFQECMRCVELTLDERSPGEGEGCAAGGNSGGVFTSMVPLISLLLWGAGALLIRRRWPLR